MLLATMEGSPFEVSQVFDVGGLAGTLSASIDWGDGAVTSGDVSTDGGGSLVGRVDYSLDTNNFFDTQLKRDLFQQAVDTLLSRLGDDLSAIAPSGGNTWTAEFSHPATGASQTSTDLQIAANEIVIYAGGRELGGALAVGGPGGFEVSCADTSFCDLVATRGQVGARQQSGAPPPTDFGPWGGSVSFDVTTDFHFSPLTDGLASHQSDFLSTAMHEVAHVLGFGTSGAWETYSTGNVFTGPASRAANGNQSVPLSSSGGHWVEGTSSDGREAALDPSLTTGTRKLLTSLDFAALDDVGWELIQPTATVTASHVYADDGNFDIVVTLAGSSGGTASANLQEIVTNVAPTLVAAADRSVGFGQPFTITELGVFTDAGFGASETFTYTIDWGDGSLTDSGTARIESAGSAGVLTRGAYDGAHTYLAGGIFDVTLTLSDDDGGTASDTLRLTVAPSLSVEVAADQVSETAGANATSVTITRYANDVSQPLTVLLSTDDSELALPTSVEIPAGEATVVVSADAVDDDILDGTQGIAISATATGFVGGSDLLIVADHETLSLTIGATAVLESSGIAATSATVTRNNTNIDSAVAVAISIDDPTEASAIESVVIPAGQASVSFAVDAIEDGLDDGPQLITITANAGGYQSASATLQVVDVISWHNAIRAWDVDGDDHVSPIDALQIVNDLNSRGSRQLSNPNTADVPPYLDVNNDGFVSPLDVLIVVNYINASGLNEEGEASATREPAQASSSFPIVPTATSAAAIRGARRSSRNDSEREIVFLALQLGDALADDLIADLVAPYDRIA